MTTAPIAVPAAADGAADRAKTIAYLLVSDAHASQVIHFTSQKGEVANVVASGASVPNGPAVRGAAAVPEMHIILSFRPIAGTENMGLLRRAW